MRGAINYAFGGFDKSGTGPRSLRLLTKLQNFVEILQNIYKFVDVLQICRISTNFVEQYDLVDVLQICGNSYKFVECLQNCRTSTNF